MASALSAAPDLFGSDEEHTEPDIQDGWWKPAEKPSQGLAIVRSFLSSGDQTDFLDRIKQDGVLVADI
jgi:hypothetical protein